MSVSIEWNHAAISSFTIHYYYCYYCCCCCCGCYSRREFFRLISICYFLNTNYFSPALSILAFLSLFFLSALVEYVYSVFELQEVQNDRQNSITSKTQDSDWDRNGRDEAMGGAIAWPKNICIRCILKWVRTKRRQRKRERVRGENVFYICKIYQNKMRAASQSLVFICELAIF